MYRFSFTESVAGKAQEVSRQLFYEIISRKDIKEKCKLIAEGKIELKRKLPAFCWHAWFDEGKRKNSCAHPSGLIMIDVDHVDNPRELYASIEQKAKENGLLVAHVTPSTKGLRLVFPLPQGMDIVKAQNYYADILNLKVDACTKDLARLSFVVPEDYWLFINEELWTLQPAAQQAAQPAAHPAAHPNLPDREGVQTAEKQPETQQANSKLVSPLPLERDGRGFPSEGRGEVESKQQETQVSKDYNSTLDNSSLPEGQPIPHSTFNIQNYENLVHELEILLGGVPMHGSRNQFIYTMACNLRYICNHDPDWVARILPTYGEAKDKWYSTIKSACNRAMTVNMPKIMQKAIERVKAREQEQTEDEEEVEGIDGSGNGTLPPHMPKTLPAMSRLLVSKTPDIYKPAVAHAVFPALAAHLWHTRFKYIDNVEHEATLMNVLMAGTGAGKSCITGPIDSIMRDIRERDRINMEKEQQWKDEMSTKGANKDKRKRPEGIIIQEVDADMTNAAFVLRMAEAEEHFLYVRMNEIEQFNALKTSARSDSQFQIMCLAFDPGNSYGQTRVGIQSVSKRVCIRFNWNASTTIRKGQQYFSKVLTDGPISRINFCTIPEQPIGAEMPVYGKYDAKFDEKLKPYIDNLNAARGLIECQEAFALAQKLHDENAEFARLSQSRIFENLSFRANVIAYLKAMILYVANGCKWEKSFESFIRWSEQYDMWCKMHFFGEAIEKANGEVQVTKRGPRNLLEELPDRFTLDEAINVRRKAGLDSKRVKKMLSLWKSRGYITPDPEGKENIWMKVLS